MITERQQAPAWLREISSALVVSPQIVLEGNIHDRVLTAAPDGEPILQYGVWDAVWDVLAGRGYGWALIYDPVEGLRVHPEDARETAAAVLGRELPRIGEPLSLPALAQVMERVAHAPGLRGALVIEQASRLVPDPQHLDPEGHSFFLTAEKLCHTAVPAPVDADQPVLLFNPILWLVGSERDLPAWLLTGNDGIRVTSLPLPDLGDRTVVARLLAATFADFRDASADEQPELVKRFAQQTDGMTLRAMTGIAALAVDGELGMRGIEDAARCYRVGVLDNPWAKPELREAISRGEELIGRRVVGQTAAVTRALDILARSATGLTGAHSSPYATRPRGVLFLAGPTGVGKTELAKALTQLVFGDENAYTRFDMSEFSEEHTAARLIGAPPGYTGFDAGGELTNAVRSRPFSLILFDEIEKAHGRILDKFLQVLEDGRLTDGRGATVFFSETILVFTSNLGIYVRDADGEPKPNVTPETPPEEAERRILGAIQRHFRETLGRPELLNRLGDNIVVFGFIDRASGEQILDIALANVATRVEREYGAALRLAAAARERLADWALSDLSNGGRGIGSWVESALVNPLSRAMFSSPPADGATVEVLDITHLGRSRYDLELA